MYYAQKYEKDKPSFSRDFVRALVQRHEKKVCLCRTFVNKTSFPFLFSLINAQIKLKLEKYLPLRVRIMHE